MKDNSNPRFRVGILGATGTVGQKFIELLQDHPWFEITALVASPRSAGKRYSDAANWLADIELPKAIGDQTVLSLDEDLDVDLVFSGHDAGVDGEAEQRIADAGIPVISNARNHRMRDDVTLMVPEINSDHVELIRKQPSFDRGGFIVTNPNCSTVGLVCALKPLDDAFGVNSVQVTTMQALSGAGYPGVASLDALGNVVPYIGGEEEKLETESLKLLGRIVDGSVEDAEIKVSAQCNRVPVIDGHLECISVSLDKKATVDEVKAVFGSFAGGVANLDLPSAPERLLRVFEESAFPQPRRHARLGNGLVVSIGRVRDCEVLDIKFVALVHNTIRGAAGSAILNAELLVRKGFVERKESAVAA